MRYIFVISSRAGAGMQKSMGKLLSAHMPGRGNFLLLDPPDILVDLLCRANYSEGVRLIVVGGDGTIHRLLPAAVRYNIPIGILPRGTANDLARAIGLKRSTKECFNVIQADRTSAIDLIAVNGQLFATCGGLGLPSSVAIQRNRRGSLKRASRGHTKIFWKATYLQAAFHELGRSHSVGIQIRISGMLWNGRAMAVVVSNQARFGALFSVSPTAVDDDGALDLCVIPDAGSYFRELGIVLQAVLGRGIVWPRVLHRRLPYVRILTDRIVPFFGDGEILSYGRDFKIALLPQAVRLIVPERTPADEA